MTELDLLTDRYRPKRFADFKNNHTVINKLKGLINCQEIPHIIIQGGPGSGKKALIMAYLREKFGDGIDRLQKNQVNLEHTGKQIDLNIIQSPYHFQINPSLHGVYDRLIIQDFLKNLVRYRTVNHNHTPYRTIVIDQADLLTHEAQQSLRRTLETYIGSFRCIFICQHIGNLIPALQSRCLILRVASPSQLEIKDLIQTICQKENIKLPEQYLNVLMKHNHGNLTRVLCDLEVIFYEYIGSATGSATSSATESNAIESSAKSEQKKLKYADISSIYQTSEEIVRLIYKSNDLMVVEKIRELFYELLIHNSDPTEILKNVFYLSLKIIPNDQIMIQKQIIETSAQHQDLLIKGSKPIFHLESYAISLLVIIKNWLLKNSKNAKITTIDSIEPVAVEPIAVEPVAVEPVAVEPVAVEPVAVEPVAVEPVIVAKPKKTFPVSLHKIEGKKTSLTKSVYKIV